MLRRAFARMGLAHIENHEIQVGKPRDHILHRRGGLGIHRAGHAAGFQHQRLVEEIREPGGATIEPVQVGIDEAVPCGKSCELGEFVFLWGEAAVIVGRVCHGGVLLDLGLENTAQRVRAKTT